MSFFFLLKGGDITLKERALFICMGSDLGFLTFVQFCGYLFQAGTLVQPPTMRVGTAWCICQNFISYYNRLFYALLLVFAIVAL